MLWTKRKNSDRGQSLVEFAIVSIVLLLILFLIIEVGRVMWAWITVQNAAREGARYAITGNYDASCLDDVPACDDPRYTSVVAEVKNNLAGLPLSDDPDATYEDDFAYFIEVYGVNANGVLQENFAGVAEQPMAVRVIYNVPIIVPILSGIAENIPVMGQVVEYNERFGSLGSTETGVSVAPALPAIPTAGPTPTPTFTPTPTDTPIPTDTPVGFESPTPEDTATITVSPTPVRCNVQFILIGGNNYDAGNSNVQITGDIDTVVTLYDLTLGGIELASGTISSTGSGTACEGIIELNSTPDLQGNHVILVESSDGTFDTLIVNPAATAVPGTATATLEPTDTPTPTPSTTPTQTPTATPIGSFLLISPDCGFTPAVEFTVRGFNWDDSETITLYFDGTPNGQVLSGHGGSFQQNWQQLNLSDGIYQVRAETGSGASLVSVSATLELPCTNVTATPTTNAPTATPAPADLIVVGAPSLESAPVIAYQPVTFTVVISNIGEIDVESQFFVDLYFDPPAGSVEEEGISVAHSNAYQALSNLPANGSRTLTLYAPFGFTNPSTDTHPVYAMVDSILQIEEQLETNNVSTATHVLVTPAPMPTASVTPDPNSVDSLGGVVYVFTDEWLPQPRAYVFLVEDDGGTLTVVQRTAADLSNAAYLFGNADSAKSYEIVTCLEVDGQMYVGKRTGLTPPQPAVNVYMLPSATGCPYL